MGENVLAVYVGEAEANMDDKNRLTIPKKYRKIMPLGPEGELTIWLIPGYEDSKFIVMDNTYGSEWAQRLMGNTIGGGQAARRKLLLALSEQVEIDRSGRALIPNTFLKNLQIKEKEFTITGNGDHLEVHTKKSWEDKRSSLSSADLWDEFQTLVDSNPKYEDKN